MPDWLPVLSHFLRLEELGMNQSFVLPFQAREEAGRIKATT